MLDQEILVGKILRVWKLWHFIHSTYIHYFYVLPTVNLSKFNKGAYITGVKVFDLLPQYIKSFLNDPKCFKSVLKRFLCHHYFYSMDEYYEFEEDWWVQTSKGSFLTLYFIPIISVWCCATYILTVIVFDDMIDNY